MRMIRPLALAVFFAACASSGIFPAGGEPNEAIGNAQRMIAAAREAGADSLAAEPMMSATRNLQTAQSILATDKNRAALKASEAAADALYARAVASRVKAERAQAQAQAAYQALPPGGAR